MIAYTELSIALCFNILLNIIVIKYWKKINFVKKIEKKYRGVQKIHKENIVPRLGGLTTFLSMLLYATFTSNYYGDFLLILLFSLTILVYFSSIEDITHNVRPSKRIFAIFLSFALFYMLIDDLVFPIIDFPILGSLIENPFIGFLFFSFALISISNGVNIIDGANGLSSMTLLTQLSTLCFIAYEVNDQFIFMYCLIFISFLFIFLLFNYPFGKVFLGDCGAYMWGWISGLMVIIFYGRHPEIPTWGAILILIYPFIETIFSTVRKKFYEKTSPLIPDAHHLHLKIFFLVEDRTLKIQNLSANNKVMPFLSIIWISPLLLMPFIFYDTLLISISILFIIVIYLTIYIMIPRKTS